MAIWTAVNIGPIGFGNLENTKNKSNKRLKADKNSFPNSAACVPISYFRKCVSFLLPENTVGHCLLICQGASTEKNDGEVQ